MILIALFNALLGAAIWYEAALAVIWCTALAFIFDGIVAFIISVIPDSLFGIDNPCYRVSTWEMELYKSLRVRLWKDKIWELGGLGGFSKKNLKEPSSPEYIEKFIIECNKGVLTHRLSYPLGFISILTLSAPLAYSVAIPVAIVNLVLNAMPTIALRYNTLKLKAFLTRLKKRIR